MSVSFRKEPRALLHVPAMATVGAGEHPSLILDLSAHGIRLRSADAPKAGKTMKLRWAAVPGLEPMNIEAEVMWARGEERGLRIRRADARVFKVLAAFVRLRV